LRVSFADLALFTCIAEAGSITAGAARAHRSLSAASERLQKLEASLGVSLLTRERRGVRLTPAGRALLHHARLVDRQLDQLHDEIAAFSGGLRARIRLLTNTSASSELLPDTLGRFLAEHPNVDVELEERPSHLIVPALRQGVADLGIVADSVDLGGLRHYPLRADRLVLACPRDHPLAGARRVDFASVLDWPLVGVAEGSALHAHLAGHAARMHRTPHYRLLLRDFGAVLRVVGQGAGVAVVPWPVARSSGAARASEGRVGYRLLPLTDDWAARRLVLCLPADARPTEAVRALAERLLRRPMPDTSAVRPQPDGGA